MASSGFALSESAEPKYLWQFKGSKVELFDCLFSKCLSKWTFTLENGALAPVLCCVPFIANGKDYIAVAVSKSPVCKDHDNYSLGASEVHLLSPFSGQKLFKTSVPFLITSLHGCDSGLICGTIGCHLLKIDVFAQTSREGVMKFVDLTKGMHRNKAFKYSPGPTGITGPAGSGPPSDQLKETNSSVSCINSHDNLLVVGYSFSCIQLWSLDSLELVYSSSISEIGGHVISLNITESDETDPENITVWIGRAGSHSSGATNKRKRGHLASVMAVQLSLSKTCSNTVKLGGETMLLCTPIKLNDKEGTCRLISVIPHQDTLYSVVHQQSNVVITSLYVLNDIDQRLRGQFITDPGSLISTAQIPSQSMVYGGAVVVDNENRCRIYLSLVDNAPLFHYIADSTTDCFDALSEWGCECVGSTVRDAVDLCVKSDLVTSRQNMANDQDFRTVLIRTMIECGQVGLLCEWLRQQIESTDTVGIQPIIYSIPNPKPVLDSVWSLFGEIERNLDTTPSLEQLYSIHSTLSSIYSIFQAFFERDNTREGLIVLNSKFETLGVVKEYTEIAIWMHCHELLPYESRSDPASELFKAHKTKQKVAGEKYGDNNYTIDETMTPVRASPKDGEILLIDLLTSSIKEDSKENNYPFRKTTDCLELFRSGSTDQSVRKKCLVYYFLLDSNTEIASSFATTFSVPKPYQNLIMSFWLVDSAMCEKNEEKCHRYLQNATKYLCTSRIEVEWVPRVCRCFLDCGAGKLALTIMRFSNPPLLTCESASVKLRCLLSSDLVDESLLYARYYYDTAVGIDYTAMNTLLFYIFEHCFTHGLREMIIGFRLSPEEESCLTRYCTANSSRTDVIASYFALRDRMAEARSVNGTCSETLRSVLENFVRQKPKKVSRGEIPPNVRQSAPITPQMHELARQYEEQRRESRPSVFPKARPIPESPLIERPLTLAGSAGPKKGEERRRKMENETMSPMGAMMKSTGVKKMKDDEEGENELTLSMLIDEPFKEKKEEKEEKKEEKEEKKEEKKETGKPKTEKRRTRRKKIPDLAKSVLEKSPRLRRSARIRSRKTVSRNPEFEYS